MTAKHIPIGAPAHDAERQAIRFLVDGLPDSWTVYSNAWLVERSGAVYEVDTVIAAPHAIYVAEIKAYRSVIKGNDLDWFVRDSPIRSPLQLNRKTSQILNSTLRRASHAAGRVWCQGFVFLSHADRCDVRGRASATRLYTRATILPALQDAELATRLSGRGSLAPVDDHIRDELHKLLLGADRGKRPPRRIRAWHLEGTLGRGDSFVEYLARHSLSEQPAVLRVYPIPDLADEARRKHIENRFRWEAQILAKVGRHPHVLRADQPFIEEAGLCLPFERFAGITFASWVDKHHDAAGGNARASLRARATLWKKLTSAVQYAHGQGVVHRLIRPDVVLVADAPLDLTDSDSAAAQPDLRLTGFDLAKLTGATSATAYRSTVHDERVQQAAPEVVRSFSAATEASDQFALGALLGHLIAGRPLFGSTAKYIERGGLVTRVRDIVPYVPNSLDEAINRMIQLEPVRRFPTLEDAIAAVDAAVWPRSRERMLPSLDDTSPLAADGTLEEGTRLGADYDILYKLGAGGLATVYAARHLVSGRTRALKVANPTNEAEEALVAEFNALDRLDHQNIVRAVDLTNVVPDRKTLAMERVVGHPLSRFLVTQGDPEPTLLQRYAEDLLAALGYLEQQEVTHKDLKPDNLIVGEDGLTVIDFSLVEATPSAVDVGTALYRDPTLSVWDHEADRYAATLCMFELYEGRHAFDGAPPEPGALPCLDPEELEFPTLAPFFAKGLHPTREKRFPSAAAMRAAFLGALGSRAAAPAGDASTPDSSGPAGYASDPGVALSATLLDGTVVSALRRVGVYTQGELVALAEEQLRTIKSLGKKKRRLALDFRSALVARGVPAADTGVARPPHLMPALVGDPTPIHRIGLPTRIADVLTQGGFATVGAVAEATRAQLQELKGVAAQKVAQIAGALHRFHEGGDAAPAPDVDTVWDRALAPLDDREQRVVKRLTGFDGVILDRAALAAELGSNAVGVSRAWTHALETVDVRELADIVGVIDAALASAGGVDTLDRLIERLEQDRPSSDAALTAALIRLTVACHGTRATIIDPFDGAAGEIVAWPWFTRDALVAFVGEVIRLANDWARAPVSAEAARRALRAFLPEYELNPLALAERIVTDVELTQAAGESEGGVLFVPPAYPRHTVPFVLPQLRAPVSLERLHSEVNATFGQAASWAGPEEIARIVEEMPGYSLRGDVIEQGVTAEATVPSDPLPADLRIAEKTPEEVVGDKLRAAAATRGFRMLVSPPETQHTIASSVVAALPGATWLSFESLLLERMEDEGFDDYEDAERFAAQRDLLTEAADELLDELLDKHGRPGQTMVLGDLAVLELCDALHLLRTLYDRTMGGARGFWTLVIPGLIHDRQPLFNEKVPVFHVDGAVLPLQAEIPVAVAA